MFSTATLIAVVIVFVAGCAGWKPEEEARKNSFRIPTGGMSPDSVSLELGVAQISESKSDEFASMWNQLDQQKTSLQVRKMLDQNGFRVAVAPSQIPQSLHELLKPDEIQPDLLNGFQKQMYDKGLLKPAERLIVHRKLQNRTGNSEEIPVSNIYPAKSWTVQTTNGQTAGAGESVSGVLNLKTIANGDGSVRLIITPEIHHGKPTTQIGVVDRSFLFQHQQTKTPLRELAMDLEILPGETVLIGATPDFAGVGELFFRVPTSDANRELAADTASQKWDGFVTSSQQRNPQRFVLIRLVHTQRDDLFSWRTSDEKLISTPHE